MATAALITVAEAEEIVEAGELDPDEIHVPGVYITKVIKGEKYNKIIEKLVFDKSSSKGAAPSKGQAVRDKIAKRACKEIRDGMYVNLGIGIPTLVPAFLPLGVLIELESENGILGVGNYPHPGQEDPDLINAGKECITLTPGSSFFSSSQSFGMIRGGHLDITILGGMQVSSTGDLANWIIPGKLIKGMGGAMDLVGSGTKVIVVMEHCARDGGHKVLKECSLPLTGKGVVSTLITEMAAFDFINGEMILNDIAKGLSLEDIKKNTGCDFKVANKVGTF